MSSLNFMELCRLCLVKDRVQIPIFEGEGDIRQIFLKIAACLPVKVKKDDKLPKKICDDCLYKLEMLYQFWNTTANAEKQLLEWLGEAAEDKKTNTEAQNVKQESLEQDPCSELAKSLSRVEAVLAEAREAESDNDHFASGKAETDSDDEPLSSLEPTTFVNVGLDGSGTNESRSQGEFLAPGAPSTSKTSNSTNVQTATSGESTYSNRCQSNSVTKFKIVKTFASRRLLKSREKGESVKCEICGKSFENDKSSSYRTHMMSHQLKNSKYTCYICKKELSCSYSKRKHMKTHSKERPFTCETCGKAFTSKQSMQEHKYIHTGERPYQCEVCGKSFTQRGNMNAHKRIHDPNYDPYALKYQCDECGKGYGVGQRASFDEHVAKHKGKIKKHTCHVCGKVITSLECYKTHMRTHYGEKPFVCEVCNKGFSAKKYLISHKRVHTGEKPYRCDLCDKSFSQKGTLNAHKRSHSNEKEFACELCGKLFSLNTLLNAHKKSHHH